MREFVVFCVFLVRGICVIRAEFCESTNGTVNKVIWPGTSTKTTSYPPCLDDKREFLYRECTNSEWGAEPSCIYLQMESPPQCPENYKETETFCWTVSPKGPFLPKCEFKDVIPFASYESVITEPVWMPVKRDTTNGIGFLLWIEPTSLYKTYFNQTYIYEGSIIDKDCLVYYNNSYIVAVSCNDSYPRICAHYKLNHLSTQLCGTSNNCYRGDFSPDSKCYCLSETSMVLHKKAEFLKPYQNNVYGLLTNDTCSIGLEKNGTYIWSNSQQEVSYTFWSSDVVFDDSHTYGASTPEGWILTEYEETCYIFEKDPQLLEPALELQLDNSSDLVFNLKATNIQSLKLFEDGVSIYCFSNAWPSLLPYRYPITGNSYEFYPYEDPGDYWCESFTYVDLQPITTTTITINGYDYFVAIMSLKYDENLDPLSQDIIDFFDDVVFSKLVDNGYKCRLKKIVQLEDQQKQVWVNTHITSSTPEDEIQNLILEALKEIPVTLVELKSGQYCYQETVDGLSWNKTKVGETALPTQLCLTPKGETVTRSCTVDNYVDGAYWTEAEACMIAEYSSLTQELYNLSQFLGLTNVTKIVDFSAQSDQLNYVDVYLITKIFLTYQSYTSNDYFFTTIDNLMNVPIDVLKESQSKFNTSSLLLQRLDMELQNYTQKQQNRINFALRPITASKVVGVTVQEIDNSFVVQELTGYHSLEDVLKIENLDSALWITPDLMDSYLENVTFAVFYKDTLFKEDSSSRSVGRIFDASGDPLNYFNFGPAILVQKIDAIETIEADCSKWSYDNATTKNSWKKLNSSIVDSSFLVCVFENLTQTSFAITTGVTSDGDDRDVTDILTDLLDNNISSSLIMEKLRNTTKRFEEFEPDDVYLVGQILEQVSDSDNIDLEDLARVVSDLHEIGMDVLSQSQQENLATDSVLHYVDKIIQNHKSDVKIMADNFMILIFGAKTNISGIALLTANKTTEALVLEGDVHSKDVATLPNLECAAYLNPVLKDQLPDDAKVIITAFSNHGLFVDKANSSVLSKIFGVILPYIEALEAPVSIVHKLVQLQHQQECVYWNYNTSSNTSGFWEEDNYGLFNEYSLIQCDFWHTTHFGLLLLDEDLYSNDNDILDKITLVNCIVSFIGLGIIFLTAVLFKKWRANTGNQVLLNFAFAVALQITIFYVSDGIYDSHDYVLCTIIGAFLHYTIISQFFWMLIIAIFQYRRFVKIMGTHSRFVLLKSCLFGWLVPLVPVLSVLIFDKKSYVKAKVALCYPSGLGLYLGVWFPLLVVIAANLFIYIIILSNVVCKKSDRVSRNSNESKYELRLAIFLFFMLGLTWIFGFLAEFNFGLLFEYLFSITVTLQGHVLFLFFILFNLNTRYMYMRAFERVCRREYQKR